MLSEILKCRVLEVRLIKIKIILSIIREKKMPE